MSCVSFFDVGGSFGEGCERGIAGGGGKGYACPAVVNAGLDFLIAYAGPGDWDVCCRDAEL